VQSRGKQIDEKLRVRSECNRLQSPRKSTWTLSEVVALTKTCPGELNLQARIRDVEESFYPSLYVAELIFCELLPSQSMVVSASVILSAWNYE
jgi:hypothetical protein